MKFNANLTKHKSHIAGLEACRAAANAGEIKRYLLSGVAPTIEGRDGFWRRVDVQKLEIEGNFDPSVGPLIVEGMVIKPREPVLEELTRHHQTAQAFIPCDRPIIVATARSYPNEDQPDPGTVQLVPCVPGEAIIVEKSIWHTLPFSFVTPVKVLTVVHRLPLDTYHDVRDLPAEGWFGEFVA
jgi:ureidoglycolate hydrolase